MNIKTRLIKLEQKQESIGTVVIACITVRDGETEDEAYQRYITNSGTKPKIVVYGTPLDERL
jgi:hypothetical protein